MLKISFNIHPETGYTRATSLRALSRFSYPSYGAHVVIRICSKIRIKVDCQDHFSQWERMLSLLFHLLACNVRAISRRDDFLPVFFSGMGIPVACVPVRLGFFLGRSLPSIAWIFRQNFFFDIIFCLLLVYIEVYKPRVDEFLAARYHCCFLVRMCCIQNFECKPS